MKRLRGYFCSIFFAEKCTLSALIVRYRIYAPIKLEPRRDGACYVMGPLKERGHCGWIESCGDMLPVGTPGRSSGARSSYYICSWRVLHAVLLPRVNILNCAEGCLRFVEARFLSPTASAHSGRKVNIFCSYTVYELAWGKKLY